MYTVPKSVSFSPKIGENKAIFNHNQKSSISPEKKSKLGSYGLMAITLLALGTFGMGAPIAGSLFQCSAPLVGTSLLDYNYKWSCLSKHNKDNKGNWIDWRSVAQVAAPLLSVMIL